MDSPLSVLSYEPYFLYTSASENVDDFENKVNSFFSTLCRKTFYRL